jgi:hypothetical protein
MWICFKFRNRDVDLRVVAIRTLRVVATGYKNVASGGYNDVLVQVQEPKRRFPSGGHRNVHNENVPISKSALNVGYRRQFTGSNFPNRAESLTKSVDWDLGNSQIY